MFFNISLIRRKNTILLNINVKLTLWMMLIRRRMDILKITEYNVHCDIFLSIFKGSMPYIFFYFFHIFRKNFLYQVEKNIILLRCKNYSHLFFRFYKVSFSSTFISFFLKIVQILNSKSFMNDYNSRPYSHTT